MLGLAAYIVKYDILLIFGLAVTAETSINNFDCTYVIFNGIRNVLTILYL
jgi:hypothetical protein